jgi:hypothetical protein
MGVGQRDAHAERERGAHEQLASRGPTGGRQLRKAIASLGFIGCGLSAIIHLSTFFGLDPMIKWPELWILHIAAMVVFASAFFSGNVGPGRTPRGPSFGDLFSAWDMADANTEIARLDRGDPVSESMLVRRFRPRPVAVVLAILGVYAMVNFAASLALLNGGVPERDGISYRLTSHGKVLKQLTESDYLWHRAYQTRLATGHWMFFFVASGVFWLMPRNTMAKRD